MALHWIAPSPTTYYCIKGIKHYEESLPLCLKRNGSVIARLHLGLRHYSTNSQRNYSCGTRWPVGNETLQYTGDRQRLLSVKHVLLHISQHRLDPRLNGRLLCHCSSHVSSPFWPQEDVVQDLLLLTRKIGARVSLFCDVWRRRRCSKWVCNVLEVGFRLRFRECHPLMGTSKKKFSSAFVDKDSIMKCTTLRSMIHSMQQNNLVEVVRNTTSPGCYSQLFLVPKKSGGWRPVIDLSFLNSFLEIPHFTMESAENIWRSLPRDAWVTSIDLVDTYFHIPIHRGYRKYLQFQTRDRIYQFWALPVVLSPAP